MNLFTDMLFIITWVVLFIFAIRTMFRGWNAVKESSTQGYSVEKRTVTKMPHPEMADVKNGDELLVVNFNEPPKEVDPRFKLDSPELHNLGDPLHQSLRDRIDELNEDDDEDDDGDIIVRV